MAERNKYEHVGDVPAFDAGMYTLTEMKAFIQQVEETHGADVVLHFDSGHNNISLEVLREKPEPKKTKLRVWTEAYRPFIMGGDVNAPVCYEATFEGEPVKLEHGVEVFLLPAKGSRPQYVVEASSGALLGPSIEMVKKDLSKTTPDVVKKQLERARERAKKADHVTEKEFWRMIR